MSEHYELAIIGGGAAGLSAMGAALEAGIRTVLVEERRIGGDCTWTGCLPSKTLVKAARVAQQMRSVDRFGIGPVASEIDPSGVMGHVRQVRERVYARETPEVLREEGIDVLLGHARFVDCRTLQIHEDTVCADRYVIAVGSSPSIPPIPGLSSVPYRTSTDIWDLETIPRRLLIIGGGPVGCEMAQAFRRLGAEVTIVSGANRLMHRDEPVASRAIADVFDAEGIRVILSCYPSRTWRHGSQVYLSAGEEELVGDVLLLAVGRKARLGDLGLDSAGVVCDDFGISVNDQLRSTQPHIYAAGDCIGGRGYTHSAIWQGRSAVETAFGISAREGTVAVPWVTFTDPEVAHVGLSSVEARRVYGATSIAVHEWAMSDVDRAQADGETGGFVRLVCGPDGRLLGATVVSERAGEMIGEWIVVLNGDLKVSEVSDMLHPYPTYGTANAMAASVAAFHARRAAVTQL